MVRSEEDYQTTITIGNHTIIADEPLDVGGTNTGPTPMEIFIGTVGACIAVTTRAYAQRKKWPLEEIVVELEMKRYQRKDYPVYTGDAAFIHEIRECIRFQGSLTDAQKAQLIDVAAKCPIRLILEQPVFFTENHADPQRQ
jgi:putative redox protein